MSVDSYDLGKVREESKKHSDNYHPRSVLMVPDGVGVERWNILFTVRPFFVL